MNKTGSPPANTMVDNVFISTNDNYVIDPSSPTDTGATGTQDVAFTFAPRGAIAAAGAVITLAGPGTWSPSTLTFASGATAGQSSVYTPSGTDSNAISATATGGAYVSIIAPVSPLQFVRVQTTPVMVPGTFGSFVVNGGWGAPDYCYDAAHSRFLMHDGGL